ncbi:MAG TPA: hypothetical protein VJT32_02490 [bacterium]|nr:hypothetical protein [bacterium]
MIITILRRLVRLVLRKLLRFVGITPLEFLGLGLTKMMNAVNGELRRKKAKGQVIPGVISADGSEQLKSYVSEAHAPWRSISLAPADIPGVTSLEDRQYYSYIGRFYSGKGAAIELGPWLGRSTVAIVNGLIHNRHFTGKKLHVYDDFVWRSVWMNDYVPMTEQLENHACFQFLFERYTEPINKYVIVEKCKINSEDGNEHLPQLVWNRGPIEIMYIDCGRTFGVNQAWYDICSPLFIPGVTLLLLQDWRTHSEVPVRWYNQIKQFVDSKGSQLQLVHELRDGGIAAFLYRR